MTDFRGEVNNETILCRNQSVVIAQRTRLNKLFNHELVDVTDKISRLFCICLKAISYFIQEQLNTSVRVGNCVTSQ